jgi:hypothetical protein
MFSETNRDEDRTFYFALSIAWCALLASGLVFLIVAY